MSKLGTVADLASASTTLLHTYSFMMSLVEVGLCRAESCASDSSEVLCLGLHSDLQARTAPVNVDDVPHSVICRDAFFEVRYDPASVLAFASCWAWLAMSCHVENFFRLDGGILKELFWLEVKSWTEWLVRSKQRHE